MTLRTLTKLSLSFTAAALLVACSAPETAAQEGSNMTASNCIRLTDFSDPALNRYWQAVNDGVMGGRSSGGPEFINDSAGVSVMRFSGNINTNGGGFSSVRANLSRGRLLGYKSIRIRARSDGRDYNLTFRGSGNWRVTHRGSLAALKENEYSEVTINFADLVPSYFGRPIDAPGLNLASARSMGIILSDGQDGSFSLDVDWVKLCGAGEV